ncbi:ABC transporter ATP-binding protein, partial [Escherichia coli]|uniref:ATP-binding cassette domain-containing protein n=1 Tax=Escherichia coli TaxID=562 RepID=UPI001BCA6004
ELMVKELLYFGRLPYKNWRMTRTKEDDLAVERALMQTELTEKAEKFVDSLSGGERQRVFIATALVQDTPILLLEKKKKGRRCQCFTIDDLPGFVRRHGR